MIVIIDFCAVDERKLRVGMPVQQIKMPDDQLICDRDNQTPYKVSSSGWEMQPIPLSQHVMRISPPF